jgi:hypothetical protein
LLRAVEAGSNAEERQPDPRGHTDALKFMRYSVKTVYGVSADTYQGTMFEPLFSTGQGSAASPGNWLTLVVILLDSFDKLATDGKR